MCNECHWANAKPLSIAQTNLGNALVVPLFVVFPIVVIVEIIIVVVDFFPFVFFEVVRIFIN